MSNIRSDWSYEILLFQNRVCPCCNDPFQLASGIIRDDQGMDFAFYVANMTPSTRPRTVQLFVRFHDKTRKKGRDRVVSLVLRMHEGKVGSSVITDKNNPLGRAMTREEVLASPLKDLIFEIADFVDENDPYVRPFLEEESTAKGRKRK